MNPMNKVLVVDDDPHIRQVVCFTLRKDGFAIAEAADGKAALQAVERERPDLIILDVMMPELDGGEVCRRVRQISDVPIIFLSSKDDEVDRIVGLELGGDDYVTKPFSPRELLARVKAVLRRKSAPGAGESAENQVRELKRGGIRLDLESFTAYWNDTAVTLTHTEFGILRTLMTHPGKVFTRDNLMAQAYDDRRFVSDRTIDSHIRRIRAKFKDVGGEAIDTVHGFGYKLAAS
jgi:two-component system OmpR family response regulator